MSASTSLCFPLATVLYSTTDMLAFPNAGRPLSFNSAGHVAGDHDAKERSYKVSPHAIERVCSGVRLLKRQVW